MNKEKLVKIKNKIKPYVPAILAITTVAVGTVVAVKTLKSSLEESVLAPLPIITGEEKVKLLERTDMIIQEIEPDLYFLSVGVTQTEA